MASLVLQTLLTLSSSFCNLMKQEWHTGKGIRGLPHTGLLLISQQNQLGVYINSGSLLIAQPSSATVVVLRKVPASRDVKLTCQSPLYVWSLRVGVWPALLPALPLLSALEAEPPTAVTLAPALSVCFSPSQSLELLRFVASAALLHVVPPRLPISYVHCHIEVYGMLYSR